MSAGEEIDRGRRHDHPHRVSERSRRESGEREECLSRRTVVRSCCCGVIAGRRSELRHCLQEPDQWPRAAGRARFSRRRREDRGKADQRGEAGDDGAAKAHASN